MSGYLFLMWRTQYRERTLEGAEAKVFAEALLNLFDEVILCDFDDYELGGDSRQLFSCNS